MKYFAVCPQCGYKLLKGEDGSRVEMMCPKCHEDVEVTITKESVRLVKKNSVKAATEPTKG